MADIDSISESAPIDIEVSGAQGPRGLAGPNSVTSATTSDGSANLSLAAATVSGLLTAGHIHGNLAGTLYTHVRTGEAMSKGDPFYISGFHVGSSQPIAMRADASDPLKMPAVGVMDADYAINTSSANGIISGTLSNINTAGYVVSKPVYVANGGGYSNVAGTIPQQVGITERANASTGAFIVTSNKVIASADISDASTLPVYNESTELFDEVAVLYNENGEVNATGFLTEGGSFYAYNGDDFVSISFAQSPLNFKIGTKQFRFNQPVGDGGQYTVPDGTGTLALTSAPNGEPDKLTNGTIDGTLTVNSTTYTYGTGAASAHRTALGLDRVAGFELVGVIRNTGSGWAFINDANHTPYGFASCTASATNITLTYSKTATKVGTFIAVPDETFAARNLCVGASVGLTSAVLTLTGLTSSGYIQWNGTSFIAIGHIGISSVTYSGSEITVNHDPAGNGNVAADILCQSHNYFVVQTGCNATQTRFRLVDGATGSSITSFPSGLNIWFCRMAHQQCNPTTLISANGNIWIYGIMHQ